jgi:antitoxin component YwqK of YwqJK toxin-antitoxin module
MFVHKMPDPLVALTEYIQEKYPEGQYLYKSSSYLDESWIVVLQLTKDSVTNQSRLPIDCHNRKFANFRASELKVIDIIHKFDQTKTINSVENSYYSDKIEYAKDTVVRSDSFDMNLDNVFSDGIHFFESIKRSFYCDSCGLKNGTGHWIYWYSDGQKEREGDYLENMWDGHWIDWYQNGRKESDGVCVNGRRVGHWTEWHENGKKRSEKEYLNGEPSGHWIEWYEDGQKSCEGNYLDGYVVGHWIFWSNSDGNYQKTDEYY